MSGRFSQLLFVSQSALSHAAEDVEAGATGSPAALTARAAAFASESGGDSLLARVNNAPVQLSAVYRKQKQSTLLVRGIHPR